MNARDVFGIVVRAAGLYCVVRGLETLTGVFMPGADWSPTDYVITSLGMIGVGLFILLGSNHIVALAYANEDGRDKHESATKSADATAANAASTIPTDSE